VKVRARARRLACASKIPLILTVLDVEGCSATLIGATASLVCACPACRCSGTGAGYLKCLRVFAMRGITRAAYKK
jgi:hypothetical protein